MDRSCIRANLERPSSPVRVVEVAETVASTEHLDNYRASNERSDYGTVSRGIVKVPGASPKDIERIIGVFYRL